MKASLQFLNERFDRFNHTIFKAPLPRPIMHISGAKSFLGQFKAERSGCAASVMTYHLTLSDRYDLPEDVLEDTVIHEMIHFKIHHAGLCDTSTHGRIFRRIMNEINSRFGRHITVSHRCTPDQLDSDNANVHSIVCVCTMTDGRQLIAKVAQTKVFELHRVFGESDRVARQEWYWVYGSYFNRFRKVMTPKLFACDPEGLKLVREGTLLEFTGLPDGRIRLQPARK